MFNRISPFYRISIFLFASFCLALGFYLKHHPQPESSLRTKDGILHAENMLMGTLFQVTLWAPTGKEKEYSQEIANVFALLSALEQKISSWKPESETSLVNRNAGICAVSVGPDLYRLVEISLQWAKKTEGAFDITGGALFKLWEEARKTNQLPSEAQIQERLSTVGWQFVSLFPNKIKLEKEGMNLGFGAIGKGYAADYAADYLFKKGIQNFIIDAGGDLRVEGTKGGGVPWTVAIKHPRKKDFFPWLFLGTGGIATSGDYERYFVVDGKRYAHILDLRTGWPTQEVISASVFTSTGVDADAIATAVCVMGIQKGLAFINTLENVDAMLIDQDQKIWLSDGLQVDSNQLKRIPKK